MSIVTRTKGSCKDDDRLLESRTWSVIRHFLLSYIPCIKCNVYTNKWDIGSSVAYIGLAPTTHTKHFMRQKNQKEKLILS